MKKYTFAFLGWVILIALGVAFTYKQENAVQAQEPQQSAMKAPMGKVVAVDTAKSEIALKDEKGADLVLAISPDTKITKEGKDITLAEVKAGDRVMFEADSASTPPVAKSLMVMAGKPAKP